MFRWLLVSFFFFAFLGTGDVILLHLLCPFHTAWVMPASVLILRAHPRKGILFTRRGPPQTNCYCFQWSLSHVASAGAPLVGQTPAPMQKGAIGHCFQCTSSPAPCEKNPFTGVCPQYKRRRGHHPRRVKGALVLNNNHNTLPGGRLIGESSKKLT